LVSEPSPWWLKGLAIFMGGMSMIMLFQIISAVLMPIIFDLMPQDYEKIEPYPENGTQEEIDDWTIGKEMWQETIHYLEEMKEIFRYSAIWGALLLLIGLFSVPILWSGQRKLGLQLATTWTLIYIISTLHILAMFSLNGGFYPDYDFGPESGNQKIPELIMRINSIVAYSQTILCNCTLVAIIILVSSKSKPETSFDIPSAFHQVKPPQD
jgi:hypothetical protein|tara:strand:+ start:246 stop:878 length:633 start_codon:yes stop_codon:yes gene_type:complete